MRTTTINREINRRMRLHAQRGFTILEVLLAGFLTALIATAALSFVGKVHNQAESQTEFSEIQHLCRASLHDIKKTMRLSGYKLTGHPAFEVKGDTLAIYFSETQPVDTVLYFLLEFNDMQYKSVFDRPSGLKLYQLMRKRNSDAPATFADFITGIRVTTVDSANVLVTIGAHAAKRDDDFKQNNGYRTYSLVERIHLRNATL